MFKMSRTQVAYRLSHQWMRRRLNAGCTLPTGPLCPTSEAARQAVQANGRQPAPVYNHGLHYHHNYLKTAA